MPNIFDTALTKSPLFGAVKDGGVFDDIDNVHGSGTNGINTVDPIHKITVFHGVVIDGLQITYDRIAGTQTSSPTTVSHGTQTKANDANLKEDTITLAANQFIIAISGSQGDDPALGGRRIFQLSFVIYNSTTGHLEIKGPYGSTETGKPFYVTANGKFVAFGGYAVNTDNSVAKSSTEGLFGLYFYDVASQPTGTATF
ncbi:hypothetical protein GGX14DRAFT_397940 [Mycena pura]|uniref:Jacalin-type lectin domain-containing protein n=1 Tax=Mycena pura TaxID=153505 RepID=A0AAD6YE54_9AGAR|nr:hypothetical protein GGX14DRAFT_397940 [Mycena pura]